MKLILRVLIYVFKQLKIKNEKPIQLIIQCYQKSHLFLDQELTKLFCENFSAIPFQRMKLQSFTKIFDLLGFVHNELKLIIIKGNQQIMKSAVHAYAHLSQFTKIKEQIASLFTTCFTLLKYNRNRITNEDNLTKTFFLITLILRYFNMKNLLDDTEENYLEEIFLML